MSYPQETGLACWSLGLQSLFLSGPSKCIKLKLSLDEMGSQVPYCFATLVMDKQRKQITQFISCVFQNTDGVNFYNILTKSSPMSTVASSLEFSQKHLGEWTLTL